MSGISGRRNKMQGIIFEFKIDDFDLDLLPIAPESRQDREMLEAAFKVLFTEHFEDLDVEIGVTLDGEMVRVFWTPWSSEDLEMAIEIAVHFLNQGEYRMAEPIMSALAAQYPDHPDILYNYGMLLSDLGRLDEAIKLLSRLTSIDPKNSFAWCALAVAHSRNGDFVTAKRCYKQSLDVDPENGYSLRNFGSLLVIENPAAALPLLEKAAKLLPDDQQAQYEYARCLVENGKHGQADGILERAIQISPYSVISELCREEQRKIAETILRENVRGGLEMDVVSYCLEALEKFEELGPKKTMTTTAEIALLGTRGLKINNPDIKYTLRSLSGEFTGLQLVSYMYVGSKKSDSETSVGIDFSKEYELALRLFKEGKMK
jgi:tetratricopeptide (TPR) repeat protein